MLRLKTLRLLTGGLYNNEISFSLPKGEDLLAIPTLSIRVSELTIRTELDYYVASL
jgi:hypothetical protein